LRQPLQFVWTEYPPCPASLCQGHDTKRVYLVHDLIEARLIQPNVAYCRAGRGDSTDSRQRVSESALVDTERGEYSIDPVPADGAERSTIGELR